MAPLFIAFVFIGFVITIAIAIWGYRAKKKREQTLIAWAVSNKFSFSSEKEYDIDARYPLFECLQRGNNRYAYNRLAGEWKKKSFFAFHYHYETYSTRSKGRRQTHHHYFSALIFTSPIPLKPLFIRPENFLDRVTEFFGADDIDFESTEFSRRFYVKSPDKRWAFDVLHQRCMQLLLDSQNYYIEFEGGHAIAWRQGTFAPPDFENGLNLLHGIFEQMPEYLLRQQKGGM